MDLLKLTKASSSPHSKFVGHFIKKIKKKKLQTNNESKNGLDDFVLQFTITNLRIIPTSVHFKQILALQVHFSPPI
jgi:hypothetical protein